MPISTNLASAPTYDDYDRTKDYYKFLFEPGVSVQTRELNQLQTLFQAQIERFGDNIFSSGTIISGCNFLFMSSYPYIKIKDQTIVGGVASPASYINNQILNETTGLLARIIDSRNGYESSDANLKTLYLNYLNTGFNSDVSAFSTGDVLKIYNGMVNGIERIIVSSGGLAFANTDQTVTVPAMAVRVTSGSFTNGEYITNNLGANVQIIGIDTTTLAATSQVILKLQPRSVDLANNSLTSTAWTILNNQSIVNIAATATATVTQIIGSGFRGQVVTDGIGSVLNINVLDRGFGYTILPYVSIRSINNISGYSSLILVPQNYIAKITVSSVTNAVGNGYAFGVNEGIIYQKGYFLRVSPQSIIVNSYSTMPNNVAVGFQTIESIVNQNIDPSLNDPAAGDNNGAPGASRLQLTPILTLTDTASAQSNSEILPIVEWNGGNPVIQQPQTVYSKIGDTMAQIVADQSGNFFIDPFLVTTQTPTDVDVGIFFNVVIDPGTAYIDGYRVATNKNYTLTYPKSFDTILANNYLRSLNYGNYLQIREVGGVFQFNTGDQISLYDTTKGFLSNSSLIKTQNTNPIGNLIGTAHIRSLQLSEGTPGTNSAIYKLYVFDINMANGKNFADTLSVYYNGTNKGIADIVTEYNSTTNSYNATIDYANTNFLVFPTNYDVVKNANNTSYIYRTIDQTLTIANTGLLTKDISSVVDEFYPYTGTLSAGQLTELYVVPISTDLVFTANLTGTASVSTTSANLIGSTSQYLADLRVGDWVYIYTTSTYDIKQVITVANNTSVVLDSNVAFANTASHVARVFPKNVPIPFGYRSGLVANVNVGQNLLTLDLGGRITPTSDEPVAVAVNIQRTNITQSTKTPNRQQYIKLELSNNAANTIGPWCLGVPDVFRLRGVYIGNSAVSNTGSNFFQSFYIDNNQNTNYYGLGYLYLKPGANVALTGSDYLLVEFDYFTTSGARYFNSVSYISANTTQEVATDTLPLANLTSTINSWEVPEFFTEGGVEVDLLNALDFRPAVQATCTPNAVIASAPINPNTTEAFDTSEKKFPTPDGSFVTTLEAYLPSFMSIFVDKTGSLYCKKSTLTNDNITSSAIPAGSMKIADVMIPAYPSVPAARSIQQTELMNTGIATARFPSTRAINRSIRILSNMAQNQSKAYTMSDIAKLDRRLTNVEYFVSLNQAETNLAQKNIPSANDPTIDRYKFGFFAVDFSAPQYMDTTNPQYTTILESQEVVPNKLDWEVYFGDAFDGVVPYINEPIVSQQNATIGSVTDPNAIPHCAIDVANSVAYVLAFRDITNISGLFAPQDGAVDVVNFPLADAAHMSEVVSAGVRSDRDFWSPSSTGSAVELYFYCYDNPVKIEIYHGDVLITDTSSAVNLSATDITNLTGSSSNQWFNDQTALYMKNFVSVGSGFVKYAGKLSWNYDGTGNNQITIRTTNGTGVRNWRWALNYPINGSTAGCSPPTSSVDPGTSTPITIDVTACGNDQTGLTQQLQQLAAKNGGTLNGLNGTINYTITGTGQTVSESLQDYLNNPLASTITTASEADALHWHITDPSGASQLLGQVLTGSSSGVELGVFTNIINGQASNQVLSVNPTTGQVTQATGVLSQAILKSGATAVAATISSMVTDTIAAYGRQGVTLTTDQAAALINGAFANG